MKYLTFILVFLIYISSEAASYQIEGFDELKWRDSPIANMVLTDKRGRFTFYSYNGNSYEFCNDKLCGVAGVIRNRKFEDVYDAFIEAYGLPGCNNPIAWFGETNVLLCSIDNEIYFLYYYIPLHVEMIYERQHKKQNKKVAVEKQRRKYGKQTRQ